MVCYLKGNPGQGILLSSKCDLQLRGWCDADWAGCLLTRRSLTGWLVFLGGSPVSWKTKKQHTVSRSSAEAEYRSMAMTTCELKWLKSILSSLGVPHSRPMSLHCDSQAALHISQNPVFMNGRNISRLIAISFVMKLLLGISVPPLFRPLPSSLTFSQRHWVSDNMSFSFASWAFEIFMHQLEGGY